MVRWSWYSSGWLGVLASSVAAFAAASSAVAFVVVAGVGRAVFAVGSSVVLGRAVSA